MKKESDAPPSEGSQRRKEFAPHQNPRKQPDGDPGPASPRDTKVNKSDTDAAKQDQNEHTQR